MKGGVYLIVKIDERTKAAIEEILSRKKRAIVTLEKTGIVIREQADKIIYRTNQNRD